MSRIIRNKWAVGVPMVLATGMAVAQVGDFPIRAHWSEGVLTVTGTPRSDSVSIASISGLIEVNGGVVRIAGGLATLRNTRRIVISAGAGNDHIVFNEWQGPLPPAQIDGGDGADFISAGSGDDALRGGPGNDVLLGGRGNDSVEGQSGSDLLIVNNGDGSDFMDGGSGNDRTQINGSPNDDYIQLTPLDDSALLVRSSVGEVADLKIVDVEDVEVHAGEGRDTVITVTDSTISGNTAGLMIDGGLGNDFLAAGDGAAVLRGGGGNDTLLGGRGNDVIDGGAGRDRCAGGGGDDQVSNCE